MFQKEQNKLQQYFHVHSSDDSLDDSSSLSGAGTSTGAANTDYLTFDVIVHQTSGGYCLIVYISQQCTCSTIQSAR